MEAGATKVLWSQLPEGIASITMFASVDGRDRLWSPGNGGWVVPVQKDHVDAVIERKLHVSTAAKEKCDEVWLVIVNDEFSNAAPAELSDDARAASYRYPFHRLLSLEPHREPVWDLVAIG